MEEDKKVFEIRDMRHKEKFFVDDVYLNGYAKYCGIAATSVYLVLCRHADKNQECFPSIELIAEKLNIGRATVIRGIKKLISYKIIMKERKRDNKQKWLNNTYVLLDKSEWLEEPSINLIHGEPSIKNDMTQVSKTTKSQVSPQNSKDTHSTRVHIEGFSKTEKTAKELISPRGDSGTSPEIIPERPKGEGLIPFKEIRRLRALGKSEEDIMQLCMS